MQHQPQNQAANLQTTGAVNRNVPTTLGTSGGLALPRWPLLAALFCSLIIFMGYVFWYALSCGSPGNTKPFCAVYHLPTFFSLLLIGLLFFTSWLGIWCFGAAIQEPRAQRGVVSSFLRQLSDTNALRPLLLIIGGAAPFWILLLLVFGSIQAAPLALNAIFFFVATWTYFYHPRRPAVQQSAQAQLQQALARVDTPLYRLRSLPLLRWIWPN